MQVTPVFFERPRVATRARNFFAGLSALVIVGLPAFVFAAPPTKAPAPAEAAEAAEPAAAAGFFTKQWWVENVAGLVSEQVLDIGLKLLLALVMFFAGWVVAKVVAGIVYKLLRKTDLDNKLAAKLGITMLLEEEKGDKKPGSEDALERGVSLVVFYLIMALVVVSVLTFAGLDQTAEPIKRLVDTIVQQLPVVGSAVLILFVAYVAALILRKVVVKSLTVVGFDKRLAKLDEREGDASASTSAEKPKEEAAKDETKPLSETFGQIVFWLVMLLGLAGAFDTLKIDAISVPLSNVINQLMGLLPVIGIAAAIGFGGYVLSKVVRAIVTRALAGLGFDKLVDRFKLSPLFGDSSPSKVVGWLAMAMIIFQTAIAALDRVGLVTLSEPMTGMMVQFWEMLPIVAISVLFVVLGVFAGRLVRGIVHKALVGIGFDRLMAKIGFAQLAERDDDLAKPAGLVAFVIQVVIVLLAVVQGLQNLGLATWAGYVDKFLQFAVTRAAVAMLVVGIGFMVGNYVRDLIEARQRGELPPVAEGETAPTPDPVWMAEFARYAVLVFAFTAAIQQLGVAENFVLISFALLFGGLCLAGSLAFGLGSRDLAGEIVRERYKKAKTTGPTSPTGPTGSLFGAAAIKPPTKPNP